MTPTIDQLKDCEHKWPINSDCPYCERDQLKDALEHEKLISKERWDSVLRLREVFNLATQERDKLASENARLKSEIDNVLREGKWTLDDADKWGC